MALQPMEKIIEARAMTDDGETPLIRRGLRQNKQNAGLIVARGVSPTLKIIGEAAGEESEQATRGDQPIVKGQRFFR
jgi:hypothetical protein